jgi:TetR/AcrR family transcriptional regulator
MARGRSATYDQQRDEILARAAELFATQGYPGTSMNEVAAACGMTKPALYHYFKDKDALLAAIAQGHVDHLEEIVDEVRAEGLAPEQHLRRLIERFVHDYGHSQHEHRVLTQDVQFLPQDQRQQVLDVERRVVAAFADAIAAVRPEMAQADLQRPLTMLLFGMMNWLFTWLKPGGALDHDAVGRLITDLFFGGLPAVQPPVPARMRRTRRPATLLDASQSPPEGDPA